MASHPTPPEPDTTAAQQAEHTQHHRAILNELIDMGADLARLVHQQAHSQAAAKPANDHAPPDPTIAFDRIARAIRRTITLAQNLAGPVQPRAAGQHRLAARKRIIRDVEDAIQRTPQAARNGAESLHAELLDRLDAPDLDDDVAHRPIAGIIADICRDLGLAAQSGAQPWKRRTPEDIEALCARAASLSRPPFATITPPQPIRPARPRHAIRSAPAAGLNQAAGTQPHAARPAEPPPPGPAPHRWR